MISSEEIRSIINDVVIGFDVTGLGDDMNFKESGLDSLDQANILLEIEEKHNVKIPDEALSECSSINGIINYLKNNN